MQIADFFVIIDEILAYIKKNHYLCSRFGCKDVTHACVRMSETYKERNKIMEQKAFQQYSDAEFRDALIATMNLKQEWMASVDKREKELGLR